MPLLIIIIPYSHNNIAAVVHPTTLLTLAKSKREVFNNAISSGSPGYSVFPYLNVY
jgi:hypothetical protein